jgi:hypothetical protein
MNLGYHELIPNYGYLVKEVPNHIMDELKTSINNLELKSLQNYKYNHELAGEIEHEYLFPFSSQLKNYIKNITKEFEAKSNYLSKYLNKKSLHLTTGGWINFQRKYEYNPPHIHDGLLSFVIWYKIPYLIEDEKKHSFNKHKGSKNGQFSFTYPSNSFPQLKERLFPIDKTKEGHIIMFPSNLNHTVYPFYTSNEYRITVAGNIVESK